MGKDFLTRKGLTLEDYLDFMSVPGNHGDELSLYLAARMCSKQVAVITKNDIWYTGKLDNDEEAFISLDDIDLILVYLGKNVFRATKPKPVLIHKRYRLCTQQGVQTRIYTPQAAHTIHGVPFHRV